MANLPPFTDDVRDVSSALAAIRARVAEGWRIDPANGCHEAPWWEFETGLELTLFLAAIAMWIGVMVTVIFTRGPVFLSLLGASVAVTIFLKVRSGRNCARIVRVRRESLVVPGYWIQANTKLLSPGTNVSVADFLFATSGPATDDVEALGALARKVREEVWSKPAAASPETQVMWTHLNGFRGGWTDVPAPWCGHPDVFLGRVTLHQTWLPHGVLDAHVQMLLVHPDRAAESACWLPREFWWREDVEALLQPKAGAGSTCGGAARSAEVS